jgi:hypothetical protein
MTTALHPLGNGVGPCKGHNPPALDIPSCFMIALWGTLALQSSMAALLAPASKCLLTAGIVRKHWRKTQKLLSLNSTFWWQNTV